MWLYRLTNKTTGKQYIGTSVNPISHRISRHVYAAKKGNRSRMAICDAIQKYGIEQFNVEQIGEANDYETLLQMETDAIQKYNTIVPNGYNITSGGRGGRRPCSQETRALISSRTKGRVPWNKGTGNPQGVRARRKFLRELGLTQAGHSGRPKGIKSWNSGRKTGPLPEAHRHAIRDGVRKVRATQFWTSGKRIQNQGGLL